MDARKSALAFGRYNNKITEMTDDYFHYRGKRYMLKSGRFSGRDTAQSAALDAGRKMFEGASYSHWIDDSKFIAYVSEFLKKERHFTGENHSASAVMFELSMGIQRGEISVQESRISGRTGSSSGGSAPPAEPVYRPYLMTPRQAFGAGALAPWGVAARSREYGGALGDVVSGATPYAPSAFSAVSSASERLNALVGGIRALSTLASMGVIRPSETGSGIDIGEVTGIGSATTPLGDAAPFALGDMPSFGDSFDIAKTPNRGEPGTWYTNSGSGQMRLYGDTGAPVVDFDFDHDHGQGVPHAHNYGPPGPLGEFNRETGRSFSLLPW